MKIKYTRQFLFIVSFIAICLIYHVDELLFVRPQSLHIWRQTNCLSITQGYNQDNLPFFEPAMQNHYAKGGTTGKAAGELPVIYYMVGKLWQIFGCHEWIFRFVQLLIIGSGLLLLFEMLNFFLKSAFYSAFVSLLLFTSPMNVFFGLNFLPDTPSVALICIASYFLFRFYLKRLNVYVWLSALFFFMGIGIKITSALSFFAFGGWILFEYLFLKPEKRIFNFSIQQIIPFLLTVVLIVSWYLYAAQYNKINEGGYSAFDIFPIWLMSKERLLQIFDSIRKMLFKEFFWPYLQYASVIIWIFLLTQIKKLPIFLRYILIVFPLGFFGYLILWFDVLDVHDYYLITSTIVMVPVWTILFIFLKDNGLLSKIAVHGIVLIFFAANIWTCRHRIEERHKGWMNEWYKQKLEAVGEIEPYLDQWGVSKNDLVISLPDYSMNGTLFLMNRKGFTEYANDFSKKETFDHYISIGAKYLILNDTTILKNAVLQPFIVKPIGNYKNVRVFDLREIK
jgi:hypothetical protein